MEKKCYRALGKCKINEKLAKQKEVITKAKVHETKLSTSIWQIRLWRRKKRHLYL